jgi:hypothetical protein
MASVPSVAEVAHNDGPILLGIGIGMSVPAIHSQLLAASTRSQMRLQLVHHLTVSFGDD